MKILKGLKDAITDSKVLGELKEELKDGVKEIKKDLKSSVKESPLFKEVHCDICGKKASLLTRSELTDGSIVCFDCIYDLGLPSYVSENISDLYDLEKLLQLKEYMKYSKEELEPKFHETASYGKIHLDETHGLFYIDEGLFSTPMYTELKNVSHFEMSFQPEELKEGAFNNKVSGSVLAILGVEWPNYVYAKTVAEKIKTEAKKTMFSSNVTYSDPVGLDLFVARFLSAMSAANGEEDIQTEHFQSEMSELEKAKVLFMLDDRDNLSLEEVKKQRNRLIRMYHPDTGSAEDTQYAQKINKAYEVLKRSLQ